MQPVNFFSAVIYPLLFRFLIALVTTVAISLALALITYALDGGRATPASSATAITSYAGD